MKNNNLKDLNLRAFPEDLHRKAKAKAAMMGISLKELIIRAITEYIKKAS
jgi:predicted HicB family RNase H-like nuclease